MIKLSLPAYNPDAALTIRATCSVQGPGEDAETWVQPMAVRFWPDAFVGDVRLSFGDQHHAWVPRHALRTFTAELSITPSLWGMHGGEGWFAIEPAYSSFVFVHDVQVFYTPPNEQDTGRAGAFFS